MLIFHYVSLFLLSMTHSIETFVDAWPHFYTSGGESMHPTATILNNLTHYRKKWLLMQSNEGFGQTYSFTMSWDCGAQCSKCMTANKFIQVKDNRIASLQLSTLNDNSKLMACQNVNNSLQIAEYKSIDELYQMLIEWVEVALSSGHTEEYTIHELLLHKTYYFPIAVKLSNKEYIGWNIVCFEPNVHQFEKDVCDFTEMGNAKEYKFWVSKKWQLWLGSISFFLIAASCSLSYCIQWLKKKKAEKIERWRLEEEKKEREQREKEKKKHAKRQRKLSKEKHHKHKKQKENGNGNYVYAQVDVQTEEEERNDNIHSSLL